MKFIKNTVVWIIIIICSPYILGYMVYQIYVRKRFLSLLLSGLPKDIRSHEIHKIMWGEKNEISEALEDSLHDLKEKNYWVNVSIDWHDVDEVEPQANSQIKHYGIKDTFVLNSSHEYESVWQALVTYDVWLKTRGYEFVLWDQGSDEYTGFICDSRTHSKFLKLGNKVGLNLVRLDHENEQ
ncbi:DUF6630 family protein [Marinomonas sp.]|uniref:DUF6630 family protein n=1 Tax=Marinomonas sp. TaxID=1904862 RepID=UPI003BAAB941